MTCADCGAPCHGGRCRQCAIEAQYEHLATDLASDDGGDGDE